MKRMIFGKQLALMVLVAGLVAGCASTPQDKAPASDQVAEVNQAIDAAEAAIAKAKSLNWVWRDTEKFLTQAKDEMASADPDLDLALKLANKARSQADLAVNQYYLEKAKVMYNDASKVSGLSANQQNTLTDAGEAIQNAEGRRAYDLLTPLMTELRTANIQYEVVRGDSLWSISGRQEIYNNPYQWPLIFKANRDQIKDADLIYPGQNFTVNRNPSASETEMAIDHARNRGAWSIGVVEESDRKFLGGTLDLQ